jgi:predicted RNase H-like HicB family nuclease
MGLEFKPYLSWEDEGGQDRYANKCEEKQTTQPTEGVALQPSSENSNSPLISSGVQQNHHSTHHIGNGNGNAHAVAASAANGAHGIVNEAERENRGAAAGAVVTSAAAAAAAAAAAGAAVNRGGELAPALAAMNSDNREYAVLVASEEESGAEYKSYFSIVLDYPQFLGQGETKESAIRQASRLLHYAFGSMLLKNESIPAPTSGAELEVKESRSRCLCSLSVWEGFAFLRCKPENLPWLWEH